MKACNDLLRQSTGSRTGMDDVMNRLGLFVVALSLATFVAALPGSPRGFSAEGTRSAIWSARRSKIGRARTLGRSRRS